MPELKQGFGSSKMNKDLDERIIPNGEYRDALNVQISTTDDKAAGTLQTIKGNLDKTFNNTFTDQLGVNAKIVGSIADEKNNKIYYLVHDPSNYSDYILEYNLAIQSARVVVADKYRVRKTAASTVGNQAGQPATHIVISDEGSATNITNVRPGMQIQGVFSNIPINFSDGLVVQYMEKDTNTWKVYMDSNSSSNSLFTGGYSTNAGQDIIFKSERTLNFTTSKITGLNILDNHLFYVDGNEEPKRINIKDIKEGTNPGGAYHSTIPVRKEDGTVITYQGVNRIDFRVQPPYLSEEYITVIKKSPLYPPTLILSNTSDGRIKSDGTLSSLRSQVSTVFIDHNDETLSPGTIKEITFTGTIPDYIPGDLVILRRFDDFSDGDLDNYEVIIEIIEYSTGAAKVKINWINENPSGGALNVLSSSGNPIPALFYSMLKQEKPLYEFKFPRFAYRYKYVNNQYSAYSPFSEPAFLPGEFNYVPKEGYNTGMVNTLRSLYIMDFIEDLDSLPKNILEVDILYKESNSNNIYTVKNIKVTDDEWEAYGSPSTVSSLPAGAYQYARTKGAIRITSEMVRAAVASNQLLRPWDNVPRNAKAQEIVGNRIVYANYLQNYNLI